LKRSDQQPPDIVVAPTLNRTWLEVAVAAHFQTPVASALGNREVDPLFANALRLKWDIEASSVFSLNRSPRMKNSAIGRTIIGS